MGSVATSMPSWETLAGGALGAGIWLLVVHALPLAWRAINNEVDWTPSGQSILGLFGLVLIYLSVGAGVSLLIAPGSFREAVAYGLGWQGVFGQYVKPDTLT